MLDRNPFDECIDLKSTIEIDSFLDGSPALFAAVSHRTTAFNVPIRLPLLREVFPGRAAHRGKPVRRGASIRDRQESLCGGRAPREEGQGTRQAVPARC